MQPYKPYDDFCSLEPFQQKKEEEGKTMEKTVLSGKCVPHNCQFKFSYLSPNPSVHLSSFWSLDPSVNSP